MFVDKQIHFQIIPRYNKEIEFAGLKWVDDGLPDPLLQKAQNIEQDVLNKIRNRLSEKLI